LGHDGQTEAFRIALTADVDNQPPIVPVVVQPRRTTAAKPAKPRPTISDLRSLQEQFFLSQMSSAQQISLLRQQLTAQARAFTAERDEMKLFMTNMMEQQRGEQVEAPARVTARY